MPRPEISQNRSLSNTILGLVGYPKDGENEAERVEWALKVMFFTFSAISLLGLTSLILVK